MDASADAGMTSSGKEAIALGKAAFLRIDTGRVETKLDDAEYETLETAGNVGSLEAQLEEAKANLSRARAREKGIQERLKDMRAKTESFEQAVQEIGKGEEDGAQSLDILGVRQKVHKEEDLSNCEARCLADIQTIRAFVADNKIDEARAADAALIAWISSEEERTIPYPKFLGAGGRYAEYAHFVRPFSLCTAEQVQASLDYVQKHPECMGDIRRGQMMDTDTMLQFTFSMMCPHKFRNRKDLPK